MARLSTELHHFFLAAERPPQVTLAELLLIAGERTFGFLFVLLSLPSALPVPAPGYSIPFGLLIFLLAIQLAIGAKRPWLPQRLVHRPISLEKVRAILDRGLSWLRRIETVSRPRLTYVCTSSLGRIVIGSAIALMAISMMIPIPGTNTLPAIGIFVTGFGLLDDDGAISLGGLVLCLVAAILTTSILISLYIGGYNLLEWLKAWFST
ncbi:exopolysaccharide biosynthesis protein [Scytonema millei]|uniref:Exopolysaccharide biosynthesis protein n=1 Tax=Scytonema millei VB511283 TaxID=1245923 RepID=A0A9X5E3P4_9CYAN|nr:exopolysaccharide biosynthesis protein [Scytonema millei]NHC34690.1 exopolysaccharide biosynthesis protein [Scytonema millei VB511283]